MCGIVGYAGPRAAAPILMEGLKRLVYRGYDSAGIAVVRDRRLHVRKLAGPVEDLARWMAHSPVRGGSGIGHTRWATHGPPDTTNAHPHTDCRERIAVVHNGIIENADELRRDLEGRGHAFRTATDTEALCHLIEEAEGETLEDRVRSALERVVGSYGIAVVAADFPGEIVVVRRGSPVLLGIGEGESFVASDAAAIRSYTDRVIYLRDGEMAVVTAAGVRIRDEDGTIPLRSPTRLPWSPEAAELGDFETFMLKEIHEQPDAVRRTMVRVRRGGDGMGEGVERAAEGALSPLLLEEIARVEIVACGTSWHAGLIGRHILEEVAGIPVQVEYASEYRYRQRIGVPDTLAIAISQSGETADTLEALRVAKAASAPVLGIVNVPGSTIDRECNTTIHIDAGPEIGVASTKAFTCQITAILHLAIALGRARGRISREDADRLEEGMNRLPELIRRALGVDAQVREIAERFHQARGFLYLGRGLSFPVALEGALKLKEVSYIHAEGYPAAEMKHGPIALVDENTPTIFVAPRDGLYRKVLSNVQEVKARKGPIVAICCEDEEAEMSRLADHVVRVPCSPHPLLSPILTVVPLQLLAYHVARLRGCNVDRPRNLAKSVTVE